VDQRHTGNNILNGGAGADQMFGGAGNDVLIGGAGRDVLTGGTGRDVFRFVSPTETATGTHRDTIRDFELNVDRIDLSAIDASVLSAGNNAFRFIGAAQFSGAAGELRYADGIISGNIDRDLAAELQIQVDVSLLSANSFLL
jgi:serralysin